MKKLSIIALTLVLALSWACTKEIVDSNRPEVPVNPFDTVDYSVSPLPKMPIDTYGFDGVYRLVLETKCAQPACHDGSFEPDYRSLGSAYNTLVYHPNLKNDAGKTFKYRVVPGEPAKSWLHYRITTNDATLGRMPLYDTLSNFQIDLVKNWITNGAKDVYGNTPTLSSAQPNVYGFVVIDGTGKRIDSTRGATGVEPFTVPKNQELTFWVGVYDDKTNALLLTNKGLKFSIYPSDFSTAQLIPFQLQNPPKTYPGLDNKRYPFYFYVKVNTGLLPANQIIYTRIYAQDEDHNSPVEIPNNGSPRQLTSYFSFIVK